jgi:uncharacterized protein
VLLETPEIKKLLQAQRDAAQRSKDEFQVLLRRADAGEAVAQAQVATRYCSGGFPDSKGRADRTKCAEYRLRAAEQGNAEAQFALGSDALRSTPEQPRDPAKALEWFKKAADAGHVQARLNAGALMLGYAVGGGRPSGMPELVDVQAGEKMLLGLAESGNGSAQMMLADAYRTGTGVSKSPVKAEAQLRMAAGKNNHLAMQRLGDLYFEGGEGVPRNVEEALRWYRLSLGKK